jgi:hypothetical protein
MKITRRQLKQLIKEELNRLTINESITGMLSEEELEKMKQNFINFVPEFDASVLPHIRTAVISELDRIKQIDDFHLHGAMTMPDATMTPHQSLEYLAVLKEMTIEALDAERAAAISTPHWRDDIPSG